jgi:uncharacterized protein YutE (UPF0331/DUF86 family)
MYFVDREQIEKNLAYLESQLRLLVDKKEWETPLEHAALERITHMVIESILDVGNSLIDGFIMRDPGSYEDIVDILMDETVVSTEMGTSLKEIVSLRKTLVQNYLDINHKQILDTFTLHMTSLSSFSGYVRQYLKNELGHVTAFKN